MQSSQESPLDASALRADVDNFLGSRAVMYRTAEALDKVGEMSRNEIAALMGEVSSRPTILDYLHARRTIAAVNEGLRAVGLDGVFGASGPGPLRPQAHPLTLAMFVSPAELEDPARAFARLHKALAKHRLKLAAPPRAEPESAEAVGMPADSSAAELLLAGGELAHLEKMGPKRPHKDGKARPAVPKRSRSFAHLLPDTSDAPPTGATSGGGAHDGWPAHLYLSVDPSLAED